MTGKQIHVVANESCYSLRIVFLYIAHKMVGCLEGWLVSWSVGRLVGWLGEWMDGWLVLVGWVCGWMDS